MPKRVKKALVKPAMRKEWLRRLEEEGQSAAEIAKADGYDMRTVRKQIELARQEREGREAHSIVLRQALERHYADLCSFAEKLDSEIMKLPLTMNAKSDRMWAALYEHLPRSPLWKMIDKMERLNNELQEINKQAHLRLRDRVEHLSSLEIVSKPEELGLYDIALMGAMNYHLQENPPYQLLKMETSHIKSGLIEVYYERWPCAAVPQDQVLKVKELITGLMTQICQWPEYEELRRVSAERASVSETAREELATIILRRVVPGRCKYCPV